MSEGWSGQLDLDRRDALRMGLVPALATIGAMALGFALVAGVLFVREGLILGSIVTRIIALLLMYVAPQFVVGLWVGWRHGVVVGPAVAAAVAPLLVFVLALGAFGGPMSTPLQVPLYTAGAVVVWMATCACGMVVGAKLIAPRPDG